MLLQTIIIITATLLSIATITVKSNNHHGKRRHLLSNTPRRLIAKRTISDGEYSEYPDYESNSRSDSSSKYQWNDATITKPSAVIHNRASPHRSKDNSEALHAVENWPDGSKQLGQLTAVSLDTSNNAVVFHRGDRVWNAQTFLMNNVYNERNLGPIPQNTIVVFDQNSGKVLREWGSNMFYMPHGLSVDHHDNTWVTDVGLHQVFKFPAGSTKPSLTLGVRFVPGNDDSHFCKPSDVVATPSGDFFVSDGYCNTRVIRFNERGEILMQFGRSTFSSVVSGKLPHPYEFNVPHALALAEDRNMLCVADRENGRIQCFDSNNGTYLMELRSPKFGTRLFSVAYSNAQGGLIYIVNGPDYQSQSAKGFVISLASKEVLEEFVPNEKGFSNPHDIAVSSDGSHVYVVELNPYKVWKFDQGNTTSDSQTNSVTSSSSPAVSKYHQATPAVHKGLIEQLKRFPDPPSSVATIVGIVLVVLVVVGIVIIAAVVRMKKRGKENGYSNEHEAKYSMLIE